MPDLIEFFLKRRKPIILLTSIATILSLIICLLLPKEYLSTATALPVNSLTADKSRIFNNNIEALYSDFGSADELDRLEGAAHLDTIFLQSSKENKLINHYEIPAGPEAEEKAALRLKKNSEINRSSYGELKVRVWDHNPLMAAQLANSLMNVIQHLYQHLQNENNQRIIEKLSQEFAISQQKYKGLIDSSSLLIDTSIIHYQKASLISKMLEYQKLIDQYQLTINTDAQVLLTVENARPSFWPDRPRTLQISLFTLFASFIFSFCLYLFTETRNKK